MASTQQEGPVEPQEYDEVIRHLIGIAAHQNTINDDLREGIRQLIEINTGTQTTLARMLRPEDNGRDV